VQTRIENRGARAGGIGAHVFPCDRPVDLVSTDRLVPRIWNLSRSSRGAVVLGLIDEAARVVLGIGRLNQGASGIRMTCLPGRSTTGEAGADETTVPARRHVVVGARSIITARKFHAAFGVRAPVHGERDRPGGGCRWC